MKYGAFSGRLTLALTGLLALIALSMPGTPPLIAFVARLAVPEAAAGNYKTASWTVHVESYANEEMARRELARLKSLGLHVEILRVNVHGRRWYRICRTGFTSAKKARRALRRLEGRLNIYDMWIGKRFVRRAKAFSAANRIRARAPARPVNPPHPANYLPIYQGGKRPATDASAARSLQRLKDHAAVVRLATRKEPSVPNTFRYTGDKSRAVREPAAAPKGHGGRSAGSTAHAHNAAGRIHIGVGGGASYSSVHVPGSADRFRAWIPGYTFELGYAPWPWLESGFLLTGGGSRTTSANGKSAKIKLDVTPQWYLRTRLPVGERLGLYGQIAIGSQKLEQKNAAGTTILSDRIASLSAGGGISWRFTPQYSMDVGAFRQDIPLVKRASGLGITNTSITATLNYAFGAYPFGTAPASDTSASDTPASYTNPWQQ